MSWSRKTAVRTATVAPNPSRTLVFVGDLVDRGPRTPDCLRIAMAACATAGALLVPGNHDDKFRRWLRGNKVSISHGLDASVDQMGSEPTELHDASRQFLEDLPPYLWLDGGRLVVAHAGILSRMIGQTSHRIWQFCLYGDTDGKVDVNGLAIRYDWAHRYDGKALVVYGHTPVSQPIAKNNTICIDTGCCFGGGLTALRYPEMELVSVPARRPYAERLRPFGLPQPRP